MPTKCFKFNLAKFPPTLVQFHQGLRELSDHRLNFGQLFITVKALMKTLSAHFHDQNSASSMLFAVDKASKNVEI